MTEYNYSFIPSFTKAKNDVYLKFYNDDELYETSDIKYIYRIRTGELYDYTFDTSFTDLENTVYLKVYLDEDSTIDSEIKDVFVVPKKIIVKISSINNISDIKIYNEILDSQKITDLTNKKHITDGCVAYLPCNEGVGITTNVLYKDEEVIHNGEWQNGRDVDRKINNFDKKIVVRL